jgi:stage III sporulation protein AB
VIRVVGAALVIFGTSAWGLLGVLRLRRRETSIGALARSIGLLRAEICTLTTPLSEAAARLARECEPPAAKFYENLLEDLPRLGDATFPELWRGAAERTPELLLNPDEASALRELAKSLGKYNIEEQRAALLYAERQFEAFYARAASIRERDTKLRAMLGVASGVFAVLLLL